MLISILEIVFFATTYSQIIFNGHYSACLKNGINLSSNQDGHVALYKRAWIRNQVLDGLDQNPNSATNFLSDLEQFCFLQNSKLYYI